MATEIQITVTPDTDYLTADEIDGAMARTLRLLSGEAGVPTRKLSVSIKCKDDDADGIKETIFAALSGRPTGIEVKLRTVCEEFVAIQTAPRMTPMDTILGFADRHGVEQVELSANGRTVTLDAQTRRNAEAMLADMPVSSDMPPHGRR